MIAPQEDSVHRRELRVSFLLAAVLLVARLTSAQGAIAGVVRDTSGAVMPGVTVEASSPALIERVRTAVSDSSGQYRVVDLNPGTYEVTFTLPGFKVFKRTGILIEGDFIAQVNAELQVGAVAESITVNAEAPTVDTINTQKSFVLNREVLDAIPTTRRDSTARALLIPGTTVTAFVLGQYNLTSHGSSTSDFTMAIDGLRVNNLCGSGQYSGYYMNDGAIQELNYLTGAESAEVQSSGIRVNQVPRDGGNRFSGAFYTYYQGSGMQADNRTDAMKVIQPNGLPLISIAGTDYDYQLNPSFGGPIAKDKLWFYGTYKYQNFKIFVPSARFPDGSQAYRNSMGNYSAIGRLTWQATPKDKVRAYVEKQYNGTFFDGFNTLATTTTDASTDAWGGGTLPAVRWTRTQSTKLLFEAGISYYSLPYEQACSRTNPGGTRVPTLNGSTGLLSGRCGYLIVPYTSNSEDYNILANVSYVTGSHTMKFGFTNLWGENWRAFEPAGNVNTLITVNTTIPGIGLVTDFPFQAVVYNAPGRSVQNVNSDLGLFGQDSWTMKRLTLHYGGRYEHFNASIPRQTWPATTWVGPRDFPALENVPNWDDWAVRFAAAYALTADGKTALKGNIGKYVAAQAAGFAQGFNLMSGATETRSWSDFNGDKTILNADGSIQTNEVIGGTANFGQTTKRPPDPDLKRGYNWEYSVLVQREIAPRVSVTGGYYRRDFYNLQLNDNLNLQLTDWSPYSINTPTDSRLPLTGQPIPMFTLTRKADGTPNYNTIVDTLTTYSTLNTTTYNGVEFTVSARGSKYVLFGGVTTDRGRVSTTCDGDTSANTARDNPNFLRFCDSVPPFRTTYKASGAYTLPYDVQLSGSFSSIPAPAIAANYQVNSTVAGRTIIGTVAGGTSTTINLVEPGSLYLDTQNRIDLRVGRNFRFSGRSIQPFAEIFNVLNAGTVTRVNETYAASGTNQWLTPTAIMEARYVRFGVQMNF
jgi:hypothetical protein